MRVESRPTTVYIFTEQEREYLVDLGMWTYIYSRLKTDERIEVE